MNSVALALLLLAGRPQEDKEYRSYTVSKQERSSYVPALERFREAERLQSDALDCAKRCGELIEDKQLRVEHWDLMIRIQNTDGSYGEWTLFAPYQLRGRALLSRAETLVNSDRREAAKQARLAVIALEESVRRGLKSSDELLARARKLSLELKGSEEAPNERFAEAERRLAEIRKLRDQMAPLENVLERCESSASAVRGTPYEVEWGLIRDNTFRARWSGYADQGKFRSARAAVAALGGFLTEAERKNVFAKIDEKSRDAARRFHGELRKLLPDQDAWTAWTRVEVADVEERLALPPAGELDAADAELVWARRCRDQLLQTRSKANLPAAPIDEFLPALALTAQTCAEAAGQFRDGDNRGFAGLEALVQDLAARRLERNVTGASTDEAEVLGRRRDEVRRILEVVENFAERLVKDSGGQPPVVVKHLAQLRSTADQLPIDPPRLDEIGRRLLDPSDPKGLWGRKPELAMELENELTEMGRTQGARLSRAARRKLGTYLLVSATARLLLAGGKDEDIARRQELKNLADKLKEDGGPLREVTDLVSPRVRDVLALLKL